MESHSNHCNTWMFLMPGTNEDIIARQKDQIDSAQERIAQLDSALAKAEREICQYDDDREAFDRLKAAAVGTNSSGYNRAYTEEVNKIIADSKLYGDGQTIKMYSIPALISNTIPIRREILQGVGARHIDPWGMNAKTGANANRPYLLSLVAGTLAGKGEKENIDYCINQLREAQEKGGLPARIVLNGFSRGASACIELARAIYLEFGKEITLTMNIHDPVPGAFRHTHSKMAIPPSVDSLVITYAGGESRALFTPQDLKEIIFDPKKTTVTTVVLPKVNHVWDAKDAKIESECTQACAAINENLWKALHKKPINLGAVKKLDCQEQQPCTGARESADLIIASDPELNQHLPPELKKFHLALKRAAYGKKQIPSGKNRDIVTKATHLAPEDTPMDRRLKLNMMYHAGKKKAKLPHTNPGKYQTWKKMIESNPEGYKNFKKNILSELGDISNKLQAQKDKRSQRKLSLTKYIASVVEQLDTKPKNDRNLKNIYDQLHILRHHVSRHEKLHVATTKIKSFFNYKNKYSVNEKLFSAINSILTPPPNTLEKTKNSSHDILKELANKNPTQANVPAKTSCRPGNNSPASTPMPAIKQEPVQDGVNDRTAANDPPNIKTPRGYW